MTESQYNSVNESRFDLLNNWLVELGVAYNRLSTITTDAGTRRYYRLHNQSSTLVAVDADPQFEDTPAFLNIANRLSAAGIHTPTVHHYNLENGFLLVEDLGERHIQHQITLDPSCRDSLYADAMNLIVTMQKNTETGGMATFDTNFIVHELNLFSDWYLRRHLCLTLSSQQLRLLDQLYAMLVDNCRQQPQVFIHRDFHSRNLMVTEDKSLAAIDFQDAMLGPLTYDPVSLLTDAYTCPEQALSSRLSNYHHQQLAPHIEDKQYRKWFDFTALQRHLKVIGIFCRLHHRDDKPHYLSYLPTLGSYVGRTAKAYPELADFAEFLDHIVDDGHLE